MKVSVVMTYYNRRSQLIRTLKSITMSEHNDYEVVIVDDASDQRIEDDLLSLELSRLPIKLIRIDERGKYGYNPCAAFNMGFTASEGQIIIIQNAENLHYGDVISYAANEVGKEDYVLFACRSLPKAETDSLKDVAWEATRYERSIRQILNRKGDWYARFKRYNPLLHWCSAISREALSDLNGFDERYAWGNDWDDNELFWRISQCRKLKVRILDESFPFVFHQDHTHALHTGQPGAHEKYLERYAINKNLYDTVTTKEKGYAVNPGKVVIANRA